MQREKMGEGEGEAEMRWVSKGEKPQKETEEECGQLFEEQ